MSKSNSCDYNNVYILVRGDETNIGHQLLKIVQHLFSASQKLIEQQ